MARIIPSVDDLTYEFPTPLEDRIQALVDTAVTDAIADHAADTTDVHGIGDTVDLDQRTQRDGVSPLQWYRNGKV